MKSLKTRKVANYITKLRGLKLDVFQGNTELKSCCKLYHKTTWFETKMIEIEAIFTISVANYITKLRGLKQISVIFFLRAKISCKLYHKTTWFETLYQKNLKKLIYCCKLYHKTTRFETAN